MIEEENEPLLISPSFHPLLFLWQLQRGPARPIELRGQSCGRLGGVMRMGVGRVICNLLLCNE